MVTYSVPDTTINALESLVDRIQADPGRMIDTASFDTKLDTRRVLSSLPEGMSEDDFIGVIKLAMLTECATDTYAGAITLRAHQFNAPWLARFNEEVWKPDEYMHTEPFKLILMGMGFSEGELDQRIEEVQQETFEHKGGDSPVHVTTFGMVQEYLTDHFHGLIAKLLRTALPEAARMTYAVKQRETLHMVWYRTMTAMQVQAQPELVANIGYELANFRLPGNSLIPELQCHAERWLKLMGADFGQVTKDLVRNLYECVESPRQMGHIIVDASERDEVQMGMIKPAYLRWALERRNGWGYGLLGEAMMERLGLSFMFKRDRKEAEHDPDSRLRNTLRTWLANRLPASFAAA